MFLFMFLGRNMYVIPFCMGPIGSPLSKIGVQITDFSYVVLSMRVMTRVSPKIWDFISVGEEFVQCVHSVGVPRPSNSRCHLVSPNLLKMLACGNAIWTICVYFLLIQCNTTFVIYVETF